MPDRPNNAAGPSGRPHRTRATRRILGALLAGLGLGGCAIATPFRAGGDAAGSEGQTVLVVVTEARLGSDPAARAAFWEEVRLTDRAMARQPGVVGHSLRRELLGDRAWTLTVWSDSGSLDVFVLEGAHRRAMERAGKAVAAMRSVRFTVARTALPLGWEEALRRLDSVPTRSAGSRPEGAARPG